MRCTILESKKLSAMLMFVVKSPHNPDTPAGKVEFIYQNISAQNAFRIIPPCDLLEETLPQCTQSTVLGRFRGRDYKYGSKNVFVCEMALMHICLVGEFACCFFKGARQVMELTYFLLTIRPSSEGRAAAASKPGLQYL